MVLVAAAICTRSGVIVVSRQFLGVSRQRIETLLTQFPRLLQAGQQHTFVETEEVRFVYQPLEAHYLVLITSKASNILQDMETLRMLTRVVAEYGGPTDDPVSLQDNALEILLAFDEVVSLGYRESVNMSQLHTILAMESQEEIVQEIIAKNKMQEAKEAAKRKIKQIEMEKKEATRRNSGSKGVGYSGGYSPVSPHHGGESVNFNSPPLAPPQQSTGPSVQTTARAGKGMKLGKKTSFID